MKALIRGSGHTLAVDLEIADTVVSRTIGLLGRDQLPEGFGLWLKPCKGVHTFAMRFAIDVIVLDRVNCVISVINALPPNRLTAIYGAAASILELPATTAEKSGLASGDVIDFVV